MAHRQFCNNNTHTHTHSWKCSMLNGPLSDTRTKSMDDDKLFISFTNHHICCVVGSYFLFFHFIFAGVIETKVKEGGKMIEPMILNVDLCISFRWMPFEKKNHFFLLVLCVFCFFQKFNLFDGGFKWMHITTWKFSIGQTNKHWMKRIDNKMNRVAFLNALNANASCNDVQCASSTIKCRTKNNSICNAQMQTRWNSIQTRQTDMQSVSQLANNHMIQFKCIQQ